VSKWASSKGRKVLHALLRIGYRVKARKGSAHVQLEHPQRGEYTWAFAHSEELEPKMLARIAKHTGLTPEDL